MVQALQSTMDNSKMIPQCPLEFSTKQFCSPFGIGNIPIHTKSMFWNRDLNPTGNPQF